MEPRQPAVLGESRSCGSAGVNQMEASHEPSFEKASALLAQHLSCGQRVLLIERHGKGLPSPCWRRGSP
eukprot:scaffold310754_cov31-Tisochrysis_lutea.AAC.4